MERLKVIRIGALIGVLLLTACGGKPAGDATDPAAAESAGASVYMRHCMACHQRDGKGLGDVQPTLVGAPTVAGEAPQLIRWVMFGERAAGMAERKSPVVMPQFAWLPDADLAGVLSHVRSSFGNTYSPVTDDEVAAVRAARTR